MKKLFNAQIKMLRSLSSKKGRAEHGVFLVEGVKAVSELIRSERTTDMIIFDPGFDHRSFMSAMPSDRVIDIYTGDISRFSTVSAPEGIAAVGRYPRQIPQEEFFRDKNSILCLCGVSDPGNAGTLVRTALCFGLDGVAVSDDCADLYSPRSLRSSMGAVFRMPVFRTSSFEQIMKDTTGYERIGTYLDACHDYSHKEGKRMLFLGNESSGLNENLRKYMNSNFKINISPSFDSLNVSVAGGVILDRVFNREAVKC